MALIGIDTHIPTPGTTGISASGSAPSAAARPDTANAAGAAATADANVSANKTGPQPLNTSGPRGTNVNIVA